MSTRFFFTPGTFCNSSVTSSFPSVSPSEENGNVSSIARNRSPRVLTSTFMIRMAMKISRSRWFNFLRRVFHYQNGSRSDLGSNPFNSISWMVMECTALVVQIIFISYTLAVSRAERPVWPMRIWVSGYASGCILNLLVLYWRYWIFYTNRDVEHQRNNEVSRGLQLFNKSRTSLELFFAIWFVMGNVWVFDTRFGSFHQAPKLHVLCISLLAWNAVSYSFPFLLFLLLCCCVPIISTLIGYNMNIGSTDRGACEDQITKLPCWRYKEVETSLELGKSTAKNENPECCICLSKYVEKEEIRQLPCSHIFHLKCVDQWLRIISCCPLCKQQLDK